MASSQPCSGEPMMRYPTTPTTKTPSSISAANATRRCSPLSSLSSRWLTLRLHSPLRVLRLLEEVRAVLEARPLLVAHCELRSLVRGGAGVAAVLGQRVEGQAEPRPAVGSEQPLLRVGDHAFHRLHERRLRIQP